VALPIGQHLADLHKENGTFFFDDLVFSFLRSKVRIHVYKLFCGNECNLSWKDLFYVIILYSHVFLGLSKNAVDGADSIDQCFHVSFFLGDDLLPVPLVHIDGVDVVYVLVAADGNHIGI